MGEEGKLDRELQELMQELRVTLPGVEVLFAFLLTIPFQEGFRKITSLQRGVFFVAFIGAALAIAFLIAPSAYHRIVWRHRDKEKLMRIANQLTIAGHAILAVTITAVIFLVTDLVFSREVSIATTAGLAAILTSLWFALPLQRRAKREKRS